MVGAVSGSPREWAVIDVETTGLRSGSRIVEFACEVIDDEAKTLYRYDTLVDPGSGPGPTLVHGISAAMLVGAPAFADVWSDVAWLLRGRSLVAHNLTFDWQALRQELRRIDVDAPIAAPGVCTAALARSLGHSRVDLSWLCAELGIDHPDPHTAAGDVRATAQIFSRFRLEPGVALGVRTCPSLCGTGRSFGWRRPLSRSSLPVGEEGK